MANTPRTLGLHCSDSQKHNRNLDQGHRRQADGEQPESCGHLGQLNVLLSAIRRSPAATRLGMEWRRVATGMLSCVFLVCSVLSFSSRHCDQLEADSHFVVQSRRPLLRVEEVNR